MHRNLLLIASTLLLAWPAAAQADFQLDARLTEDGLRGFHLAVGDYYRVPEREILVVRERRIPDDELPVVFFLASRAHCAPEPIVDLRLAGQSWIDIAWHFGLSSRIFYVPLERDPGPPFGRAYGHFKHTPRSKWHRLRLADEDVVNLVNLRFISDHYHCSPEEVTRLRGSYDSYVRVASDLERHRDRDDDGRHGKHGHDGGKHRGKHHG